MSIANTCESAPRGRGAMNCEHKTGGALYYPAFDLGTFPNLREALASIGGIPDEDDGWAVDHDGGTVTITSADFSGFQCLILPQAGAAVSVAYLFGDGFACRDHAETEAARCTADAWPVPGASDRWGVICRTRGALQ